MNRKVRAGLITIAFWSMALLLVGAAASVCSSCGGVSIAAVPAQCAPVR